MCSPLSTARFGEQLPWLLRNLPSLAALPCDVDAIRAFDASADGEDSVVAPSRGHLAEAQAQLLAEGARGGVLHTPEALLPVARRRERMERDAGRRWQRATLQTLLYGGEHYHQLLGALSAWFRHRELSAAATHVQQHYRERKVRKLMRVTRVGKELRAEERRKLQETVDTKAASVVQAHWRGHLVRRALREASGQASANSKRAALDELRRTKQARRGPPPPPSRARSAADLPSPPAPRRRTRTRSGATPRPRCCSARRADASRAGRRRTGWRRRSAAARAASTCWARATGWRSSRRW